MKLYEYLENEYTATNIQLQSGFEPSLKSKTDAVSAIIKYQKAFYKTGWFFRILASYLLCLVTGEWPDKANLEEFLRQRAIKPEPLKAVPCPENNAN